MKMLFVVFNLLCVTLSSEALSRPYQVVGEKDAEGFILYTGSTHHLRLYSALSLLLLFRSSTRLFFRGRCNLCISTFVSGDVVTLETTEGERVVH